MKSGHLLIGWCFSDLALFGCLAIEPAATMFVIFGILGFVAWVISRDHEEA